MKIEITSDELIAMLKYFQKQDTCNTENLAKEIREVFPKKMAEQWTWTNGQPACFNISTTSLKG